MNDDSSILSNERLLTIAEVCATVGRSRASIYRDIAKGAFPRHVKSGGSSRWLRSEVLAHIAGLPRSA